MPEDFETKSPEEWLAEVRRYEREGELFRAYDLAKQGLENFPDDLALKHRAVLCLASTGATSQALELFARLGLDTTKPSLATRLGLDVAALRPRLMKEMALAAGGTERPGMLDAAAKAYTEVYEGAKEAANPEAYYPGINAATLSLLAKDEAAATGLARDVRDQLATFAPGGKSYYEIASELEAELILGDTARAREMTLGLRAQIRSSVQTDYRGLSSTVRQLRLVCEARGLAAELLHALDPPRVIHYLGHIIAAPGVPGRFPADQEAVVREAIDKLLDAEDVGFGYGSLAAGADILFAEALLGRGASLHVVLPFDREEFVEVSVRPSGVGWVKRFEDCLRAAEKSGSMRFATEDRYLQDDQLFDYCSQLAMGLAVLRAQHLSAPVEQIAVWDGLPPSGPTGTAVDMATWQRAGLPRKEILVGNGYVPPPRSTEHAAESHLTRRPRAMLFSDIHGFSGLRDNQLPPFITVILECCAQVIAQNRTDILFVNTWGDGLFLAFDDAGRAASCALELQEALGQIDLAATGFPTTMGLRVGLHLGPVYTAHDPILGRENIFGAHVSRTARVEPVTPEGCVYVTETMAAVLALHNAHAFTCEYVGMTEAAKHYGPMRMFLLGRCSR